MRVRLVIWLVTTIAIRSENDKNYPKQAGLNVFKPYFTWRDKDHKEKMVYWYLKWYFIVWYGLNKCCISVCSGQCRPNYLFPCLKSPSGPLDSANERSGLGSSRNYRILGQWLVWYGSLSRYMYSLLNYSRLRLP